MKKADEEKKEYVEEWGRLPGQPRKIKSVDEMEKLIDRYFLDICNKENRPTVEGLAIHLGFLSRQSLLNYEGYGKEYKNSLKRAKLYIESQIVQGAMTGKLNSHFCTFSLKNNFGWKEKTELEVGNAPSRRFNINFTDYEKKITNNED